ncbi:hypothetical protein BC936DRAFT_145178 [Jimgerdemannia flammicorona]|uniref:Uncharacterized protein n=1 Tax=Jimgerdemannia flammicorona TaxID=994334 RepID=A0A433DAQ3_9FUNG|nr:hypothetical protein BC936DRAFT_145178 [Jimgerdemannia flammicorona]
MLHVRRSCFRRQMCIYDPEESVFLLRSAFPNSKLTINIHGHGAVIKNIGRDTSPGRGALHGRDH